MELQNVLNTNASASQIARQFVMILRVVTQMIGRAETTLRDVILEMSDLEARLVVTAEEALAHLGCRAGTESLILYGVATSPPIYVGGSPKPFRRIPDLCEGESHHLAKLLPILAWERIMLVRLDVLLARDADFEAGVQTWGERRGAWCAAGCAGAAPEQAENRLKARERVLKEILHAVEREVQLALEPVINIKRRVGRKVGFPAPRRNRPCRHRPLLRELFPGAVDAVLREFEVLREVVPSMGQSTILTDVGAVIFVQDFLRDYDADPMTQRASRWLARALHDAGVVKHDDDYVRCPN